MTQAAPHCKACDTAINPATDKIGHKNGYDLLKCTGCGTATISPFPSIAELIEFYQSYEGTVDYQKKADKKIARAKKRIARLKGMTKGNKFLDVGCNYGFTIKAALDLGLDATGIDIDDTAVTQSKKSFGDKYFYTIPVEDYAAGGKKADIIYTSEVVEHVHNPDSFVASLAKILNDDGIIYLTTPDSGHWRVPKPFEKWEQVIPPEHINYFNRQGMTTLFEKHGLTVEKYAFNLKPGIRLFARKKKA